MWSLTCLEKTFQRWMSAPQLRWDTFMYYLVASCQYSARILLIMEHPHCILDGHPWSEYWLVSLEKKVRMKQQQGLVYLSHPKGLSKSLRTLSQPPMWHTLHVVHVNFEAVGFTPSTGLILLWQLLRDPLVPHITVEFSYHYYLLLLLVECHENSLIKQLTALIPHHQPSNFSTYYSRGDGRKKVCVAHDDGGCIRTLGKRGFFVTFGACLPASPNVKTNKVDFSAQRAF